MILKRLRLAEKGTLDLSLTEPPLLFLYLVVLFFIFTDLSRVLFFLFHQSSLKATSLN